LPPFRRARATVSYSGVARQMVHSLKYRDRTDLPPWMLRAGSEIIPDADIVVPVPLHWRRFFTRRFNQSAELTRAAADLTGKRFELSPVRRVKVTRQQVGLSRALKKAGAANVDALTIACVIAGDFQPGEAATI
jgi:predicted amidophosphoribosyltransferase